MRDRAVIVAEAFFRLFEVAAENVEEGLLEMLRVLKRGGRLLILDFGKPKHPFLRRAYFLYLKGVSPLLGKIFCACKASSCS